MYVDTLVTVMREWLNVTQLFSLLCAVDFVDSLNRFTRFSRFNPIAQLRYGEVLNVSNIVSSIEFDKDDENFACAGVLKKIRVYDFQRVVSEPQELVYPLREISTRSKIRYLSVKAIHLFFVL